MMRADKWRLGPGVTTVCLSPAASLLMPLPSSGESAADSADSS